VRDAVGESIALVADANGSFAVEDLDTLRVLDGAGLACLEQPLPADDLVGSARVAAALVTPICLDESIGSPGDAAAAIALGACSVVNVKAARVGGLAAAKRVHHVCAAAGVACRIGGMLETGIGRAAAVALGALPGFTVPGDLAATDRYWAEDITAPFVLDDHGHLPVPDGPVAVREDVLDRVTTSVEVLHR
jgi:O-succinylbenzoate synthase